MSVKDIFSDEDLDRLEKAIESAELMTSGEIRVHLENSCNEDVMDHAAFIFKEIEMHHTQARNGVLIYLAVESRKFAIIGDAGINVKVPEDFWDQCKQILQEAFVKNEYVLGLEKALSLAGKALSEHFPIKPQDKNELSNTISIHHN